MTNGEWRMTNGSSVEGAGATSVPGDANDVEVPPDSGRAPTLRILTYNVLYGGSGREQRLRGVLQRVRPDIAIFTEARATASFDVIAETVGPFRARSGHPDDPDFVVIVSRWPIVASRRHGPPWARLKWIEVTTHPFDGAAVTILGVHLSPQLFWPFELVRRWEVGVLLRRAARTERHLIGGDFNALAVGDGHRLRRAPWWVRVQWTLQAGVVPRWALRRLQEAGYVDCYRDRNPGEDGFTVPSWDPQMRLDYLLASRTLRDALRDAGVAGGTGQSPRQPRRSFSQLLGRTAVPLDGDASDHLAVWADFSWI